MCILFILLIQLFSFSVEIFLIDLIAMAMGGIVLYKFCIN